MSRDTFTLSQPGFIADANSIVRRQGGVQIDWTNVPSNPFLNAATGKKEIPAGYPLAEPTTVGQCIPRTLDAQDAVGLLETNAVEGDLSAAKTGYGLIIGGSVLTTRLPITITSATRVELQAVGIGFNFQTPSNSLDV